MDRRSNAVLFLALTLALAILAPAAALAVKPDNPGGGHDKPDPTEEPPETAGNNLSYPVIWAEGVTKTLPVPETEDGSPVLDGDWWYQWGTNGIDPDVTPASCAPDPDESGIMLDENGDPVLDENGDPIALNPDGIPLCDDGVPDSVDLDLEAGTPAADNPLPLAKAYLQKDVGNTWQAGSADWSAAPVNVDRIDWGDNLESVDWYTKSQVRTEVVLFQDLLGEVPEEGDAPRDVPMLEYEMRHTSGWGIDEVHGLAATLADEPLQGPGTQATVYSHCARLTIQKLLVDRDDPALAQLVWVPGEGWTEPEGSEGDLINAHIFNGSVHEGGDGPGYYSAEINVKGRIIYGYTWNVQKLNQGPGDYRLTFSLDGTTYEDVVPFACGTDGLALNTFFVEGTTTIDVPLEEEVAVAGETDEQGGTAELDFANNLTYIDIHILEKGGGKK